MKSTRRRWLWLGASTVVLGLIIYHLSRSAEWRAFRWDRFWSSLMHARPSFLLAALAATYSSYLLRAYRWKFFLDPIKKASVWVLFVGQILGFSSIYLIGRLGEFVRPAYIARKEKVPISAMLAVLVLERVYDAVFMVFLFASALYLAPRDPAASRAGGILVQLDIAGLLLFVAMLLLLPALVWFRLRAEAATRWIVGLFGFLRGRARLQLEHFLRSFAEGLKVIHNWRELLASIVSTAILWILNASVFWLVFQALGGEVGHLTWLATVVVLFFAVIGLSVQVPGIGGGYQVFAILALTKLYSVGVEVATGAAILVWIMISVPCLALGGALLVHEGLTFRKLEAIAEEERAVAEHVEV
jgi:uncharacterized protein (TIRG00374 family)